jgi:hypothetical protein
MRWQCPHCGTPLAASETSDNAVRDTSRSGGAPTEWKLFACYKCGGFSMRNLTQSATLAPGTNGPARDPNQPPPFRKHQPRVLHAHRSAHDSIEASATRYSPQQIAPPKTPPVAPQKITAFPQPEVQTVESRSGHPPEPPVDFEVLRSHLRLDSKRQQPQTQVSAAATFRAVRSSPSFARQAVLSFLLIASAGTGYLLYQQGVTLQKIAGKSAPRPSAPGNEIISDTIGTSRAAPFREEPTQETRRRIQVDLSEPGMRYEYLDRRAEDRPAAIGD